LKKIDLKKYFLRHLHNTLIIYIKFALKFLKAGVPPKNAKKWKAILYIFVEIIYDSKQQKWQISFREK